jgi:hypothetical protein
MRMFTGLVGFTLLLGSVGAGGGQEKANPAAPPAAPTSVKPNGAESVAPDIKAEALWDGRKMMPFHAKDNPRMVKAAEADFLEDGEYVLGLTINGESRAYPTRFAQWHHIINDKVGKAEAGGEAFVTVTF